MIGLVFSGLGLKTTLGKSPQSPLAYYSKALIRLKMCGVEWSTLLARLERFKRSVLLPTLVNYDYKKFYNIELSGLYHKVFTIVIYDHNDSCRYYKITITILIYNPS